MDQKFYLQPFAFAGDVTAIPDALQPSGAVSFNQGFGFDYQRELGVDPDAKAVPRQESNYLYKTITENLGVWQRYGSPEWITAADNGGVAYPYARGVIVRYRALPADPFQLWISRVDNNTTTPVAGTDWAPFTFEIASNAQALAGTDNTTIMSPLRVAEAVAALAPTIPDASETVKGKIELATQAEVNTGTDAVRAVTPATLAVKVAAATPDASTTVKGIVELATSAETSTGTDAVRAVTPAGVKPSLDLKAPLASPALTGTPTAPTAAAGTNTTQLATTAFVTTADNLKANIASPVFTGVPAAPTAVAGTNTTQLATCAFVQAYDDAAKANLASPTFTGVPAAPTAAAGTNTTQLATTAFVTTADNLKANIASPTFTGTPAAPTAATATNTTQLATTAFVQANMALKASLTGATFTGPVVATTLTASTSDARLKDDIADLRGCLDTVLKLRPRSWRWKADGAEDFGWIAQEHREVIPLAVHEADDEMRTLSVRYGKAESLLVGAVHELYDRIVAIENRLTAEG